MDKPDQRYVSPHKVIPGEDLGNIIDGSRFARQARAELSNAKRSAAEAFEKARDSGYEEGVRRGRQDTLKALRAAVEETRKRLMSVEEDLDLIVIEAVEKIIGTLDEREVARRALQIALNNLATSVTLDILVAPDDLAAVRADVGEMDLSVSRPEIRSIREDSLLKPGEMVIVTPQGRIQVGVAQQIGRLKSMLQGAEE